MTKVITCTGYGGTGSSVVSDLLKEFDEVNSFGDFEFRFLQDPRGIKSLEFGIYHNNDRLISSAYIQDFVNYVNYLSKSKVNGYENYFDGKFKSYSLEYVNELVDVTWKGFWHNDIIKANFFQKTIYYTERAVQKYLLRKKEGGAFFYAKLFSKNMYYSSKKAEFLPITKKYLDRLVSVSNKKMSKYLVFDQLIPAGSADEYIKYFNDIKVVIVDRDPVDLYLLNKVYWNESWIPTGSVDTYIEWYKSLRKNRQVSENVFYVQFEDFIYKYDMTVSSLLGFVEIDKKNHLNKKKFFDPSVSISNTHLESKHKVYLEEIRLIKESLSEYCYKF
ncbi:MULTISPECIES: hypothetical protein [Vibrio]|uniref:hypothetical protein n=1 Tax=Vibrio TaxID=662 RepID=UPI000C829B9E|nr:MULTISPECIES: hypothetical protein [Vibrio]PMH04447.1 hypothetical protein BCU77_14470 [Vibrio splendidus]PMI23369.1 hypothetical protein BCU50_06500 [Vibrio sp. 10N.286.46.E10]